MREHFCHFNLCTENDNRKKLKLPNFALPSSAEGNHLDFSECSKEFPGGRVGPSVNCWFSAGHHASESLVQRPGPERYQREGWRTIGIKLMPKKCECDESYFFCRRIMELDPSTRAAGKRHPDYLLREGIVGHQTMNLSWSNTLDYLRLLGSIYQHSAGDRKICSQAFLHFSSEEPWRRRVCLCTDGSGRILADE